MKKFCLRFVVFVLTIAVVATIMNLNSIPVHAAFSNFITVDPLTNDKLKDGEDEFRFIGMNIQDIDPVWMTGYPRWETNAYKTPTDWELEDIVKSVYQMGSTVLRVYALSTGSTVNGVEKHVMGINNFSVEAFERLDTLFDLCDEYGVRIILGLVDYQDSIGGVSDYAAWRGKDKDDFFTDYQIIEDFKKTIDFVTNRYENEKALLCWETGNEFPINAYTDSWSRTISAYIKSKDSNHLVADGRLGISADALTDSNIDIVVNHLYHWVQGYDYDLYCYNDRNISAGKKVYIVEEFGYAGADQEIYHDLLDQAIYNGTSGVMLWAMAHHNEKGGFYWHDGWESTIGYYWTYHWPGFSSGNYYNEQSTLELVREHAYQIRGLSVPSVDIPDAPTLLDIDSVRCINWKGSAGASSYDVERATSFSGPWTVVGNDISDADKWKPSLYDDISALGGTDYYYRIKANNSSGSSSPSNVVGPITASNTYSSSADFDENYINGHKGWYYKTKDLSTGAYVNMYQFSEDYDCWFNAYSAIGSGWQRPGNSHDSILSWYAPRKGIISIDSTATLRNYTADGAYICIKKSSGGVTTTVINTQSLAYGTPVAMDVSSLHVNQGDLITFEVNKKTAYDDNEIVDWDPAISFTLGTFPTPDPSNMVLDPGFEQESESPWVFGAHFGNTSADYRSGGYSSAALVGTASWASNLYQQIEVDTYTPYKLEFYGKSTGAAYYSIMGVKDGVWEETLAEGYTIANYTWTKYTASFETKGYSDIILRIADNTATYNYFDDFNMYKATNLISNPGFEDATTSPWVLGSHYSRSSTEKFGGTYSMKVSGSNDWCSVYQSSISVTPNTNYTLRFFAKTRGTNYYSVMDTAWTALASAYTTGDNNMRMYSLDFYSGSNSSVIIRVCDNTALEGYLDDFYLYIR